MPDEKSNFLLSSHKYREHLLSYSVRKRSSTRFETSEKSYPWKSKLVRHGICRKWSNDLEVEQVAAIDDTRARCEPLFSYYEQQRDRARVRDVIMQRDNATRVSRDHFP